MFLIAAVIAAAGFCVIWFLQEQPLRETVADQGIRDSFATPREITSLDELETRLGILEPKHERHRVSARLARRAGLAAQAQPALLLRLDQDPTASWRSTSADRADPRRAPRPFARRPDSCASQAGASCNEA
jgi:hypothetical protein